MKLHLALVAPVLALGVSAVQAVPTVFQTVLSGANEAPANASTASGLATVTYDSALHSLFVAITFAGLSTPASAGHIHCCTTPGSNIGVAVPFSGLPSALSGNYSQAFDLTLAATYTAAFVTANGGTAATAESALATGLAAGRAYANLHDSVFPGGEIRGFLQPVPEPTTSALLLAGLGVLGAVARRRAR